RLSYGEVAVTGGWVTAYAERTVRHVLIAAGRCVSRAAPVATRRRQSRGGDASRGSRHHAALNRLPHARPHSRRTVALPRLDGQLALTRPHFVERVRVVQPAVLHHVPQAGGVAQVLERIAVEHEDVGEL